MNKLQLNSLLYGISYIIFSSAVYFFNRDNTETWNIARLAMAMMIVVASAHFYIVYRNKEMHKVMLFLMITYFAIYTTYLVKHNSDDIADIFSYIENFFRKF